MDPEFSAEDVLLYQRAATTNHEVLQLLGQVSEAQASTSTHQQALELSRTLHEVLGKLLEAPIERSTGPLVA